MNPLHRITTHAARRAACCASALGAFGTLAAPAMAQTPARTLDTVSVVASRAGSGNTTRSVETITRGDIARTAARTIADVLATAIGVDLDRRSAAQADLSIRGSSPEQVVILVDGVRMSDVQSAHYALDLAVPLASVDRIEILRGAGSALYGPDAIGGVVNIVTRSAAPAVAELHGGTFGTIGGEAIAGARIGTASLASSADFEKSDGHRDGTDYRDGQGRLSLTAPAGSGVLRANLGIGVRDFGAAAFYAPYNSIERTTTTTLDARLGHPVGAWTVDVGGSTRRHGDDYVLVRGNPSLYENRHTSWQTSGDVVARTAAGPLGVALGAEGVHDQLSSARLGGRREARLAAFAEGTIGAPDVATLDVGVRGDRSSVYGAYFSPSLSAAARLAPWLTLRSSGATGFRAPTWTERYYTDPANQGDPNLRPERFWTADVGAHAVSHGWALDASGWTRRATNLIDWVHAANAPTPILWRTMNVGTATFRGIDGSLALPASGIMQYSLIGSGLTLDASQGAALVGKYALRPITRQLGVRAALLERAGLSAQVELIEARRAHESAYLTGNARVAWRAGAYRLTVDVMNAANAAWLDASGQPSAGRGIYVGLGRALR